MKGRYVVARAADLPPSSRQVVTVGEHEIGIFNLNGSYYALLNRCPHRAGPLCHGRLRPMITSTDVGQVNYAREGEVLKCPWHQWEFDIRSGQALYDTRLRARTYQVVQEGDDVVLYL
jgi:3-phenylpropionate/trans-cinnamate dioxygenase ferredoxin subunit